MRNCLYGLLVLCFGLLASAPGFAQASCVRSEQIGCIEIDFLVVENNSDVKEISDLVTGKKEGGQVAPALYQMSKRGRVRLYDGCVLHRVWAWGINNSGVPSSAMATYDAAGKRSPVSSLSISLERERAPIIRGLGEPMAAFEVNVCGGKGAIQFPWEYITQYTYMIICPVVTKGSAFTVLHPYVGLGGGAATHLTRTFWEYASNRWQTNTREAWEFALTVAVVKPTS